ncbi:hypothetical protein [Rothia nasimurium]|uniref:hypothetical protein n=1 Tax=Rothia nasimurium TaxID=85336 RepID=UPI003BA0458F
MSQNQSTHQDSQLTAGQLFMQRLNGVIGVVAIISTFIYLQPQWGAWTKLAIFPLVVSAALAILITTVRITVRVRAKRNERLIEGLRPLLGAAWNPKRDLKTSRYKNGRPQRILIDYPNSIPDHEPEWRKRVEEMARRRMEVEKVNVKWNSHKGIVDIRAKTKVTEAEKQEEIFHKSEQRVHDILRPMFGTDIKITVQEWQEPQGGKK